MVICMSTMGLNAFASVNAGTHLTLEYKDGTKSHYAIADKPVLTVEGEMLRLKSDLVDFAFDRSDLVDFHFTDAADVAGLETVAADDYSVTVTDNRVTINGSDLTRVEVYDIKGLHIASLQAADGCIDVDMNQFASGVYVIAVAGHPTLKVLKK